jgi:hypothetical protein
MTALYEAIAIVLFFCLLIFVTSVPEDIGCNDVDQGESTACVSIHETYESY